MTNGKATEAQILQRNESRDVHMPRGALNTEGPKNQNPRPFAETARDKDGVPGLLSFTSWAATPAAQDLRGGSTQRAAHHIEMRGDSMRKKRNPLRDGSDENNNCTPWHSTKVYAARRGYGENVDDSNGADSFNGLFP
jgi:hypothetical protein